MHGDDPIVSADGTNICEELSKIGRFKVFKRTTGISTTNITGRLLRLIEEEVETDGPSLPVVTAPKQQFLQTSTRIANFSNHRDPKPTDTVVYIHGSCDLMHPGVIERIKQAKAMGDFLYVGVWDDEMVRYYCGKKLPV